MSFASHDVGMVSPDAAAMGATADGPSAPPTLLGYPATYFLIAVNLSVYLLMYRLGPVPALLKAHAFTAAPAGAGRGWLSLFAQILTAPFSEHLLIAFGSCVPGRVVGHGEWWRLFSSIFVHVTLLHLLLNMWCLWNLGLFGEPLLGKPGLVAVYLLTGVAGMLQSVIASWAGGQTDLVVAGASGAVFGLAGILIVLLSNRRLAAPWEELRSLRLQVIFFALANLLLGMLPGLVIRWMPALLRRLPLNAADLPLIDNNAHLGGFFCGLALGVLLYPRMTSGRSSYRTRQALVFGSAALLLTLLGYAFSIFVRSPSA